MSATAGRDAGHCAMKSDLFDRFPLALILILVVLFFWRLSLSQQFTIADNPDVAFQVLP